MAMDGTRMGDAIETAIENAYGVSIDAATKAKMKASWEIVATAIIAEITGHLSVTSSVAGVQAGGGTAVASSTAVT